MSDTIGPLYEPGEEAPPSQDAAGAVAIKAARAMLNPVRRPEPMWPLIASAALCACAALAFATAVILGPPNVGPDVTVTRPVR